jgi:hypothetical protein
MTVKQDGQYAVVEVVLHTSATPGSWWGDRWKTNADAVTEMRRWHTVDRGWRDIGYHRIVTPDGVVGIGRSIYTRGAGVGGHNSGVVHICMVPAHGDITKDTRIGKFEDYYTREQRVAVRDYILELHEMTGVDLMISGHNDYASKLCPGFKVRTEDWL